MCGLTGFLDSPAPREKLIAKVTRMADTLAHRGPDDSGAWVDEEAGIALGFRRLSVIDLSPAAHQPMESGDGRYVVVFNGEIYNHCDLRAEMKHRGVRFRSTSDTEILLECAAAWGPEATFPKLWGMFAIALWDCKDRVLFLARDRVGKKPLYYSASGGTFLFASELKALRAHPEFDAAVNRDALSAYLRFGYVPTPLSIYSSVKKLLPGHYAMVRAGHPISLIQYWNPLKVISEGLHHQLTLTESEAAGALESLLRDAVRRRMIADVPLGALLSGGVDSSTVVALMQQESSRPVRTFTIGFAEAGYNEAKAAKAVAKHLGTDHTELYVTPEETQSVIPLLPQLYDEPFADSSQIPTFVVCKLARKNVTVSLTGDGGDETLCGYTRYGLAQNIWKIERATPLFTRRLVAQKIRRIPVDRLDMLYKQLEWLLPNGWHQSLPGDKIHKLAGLMEATNPDDLYKHIVSQWKNPDELVIGGNEPKTLLDDVALRKSFPDFTQRMMFMDLCTYLPDDILVKVDRASMGVSLEIRSPFLDHRVVEWAWKLPPGFRQRHGQSKWLLRQILHKYVPPSLMERPKMGFGVPIGPWLRGNLRDWAEDLLSETRIRQGGFLNPEPIRKAWTEHLSGFQKEEHRLWSVLMFQAWLARERLS